MSEIHTLPIIHKKLEKWVLATFARHVLANIKLPHPRASDDLWYEYQVIKKECQKLIGDKKPKHYKSKAEFKTLIEFKDWPHLKSLGVTSKSAPECLSEGFYVEVHLHFKKWKKANGNHVFSLLRSKINIDVFGHMSYHFSSLNGFQKRIFYLKETLHHELQHLSQSLMGYILSYQNRSPTWKIPGNPTYNIEREEYFLYPEEFYPWLTSSQREFNSKGNSVAINHLRLYTSREFTSWEVYSPRTFLAYLHKYDLVRWKKAIKEIYKYLEV